MKNAGLDNTELLINLKNGTLSTEIEFSQKIRNIKNKIKLSANQFYSLHCHWSRVHSELYHQTRSYMKIWY